MGDHSRVDSRTLKAAATTCAEAATMLARPLAAFKGDAAPTGRCFGLVEGASEHLGGHYSSLHTEVSDYVTDLQAKLTPAAEALMRAGLYLEDFEEHGRAEAAKILRAL